MTAEFAVALPAVVLVLSLCLAGVGVAGQQLRLQDAAASAARALARGGSTTSALMLAPGAVLERSASGDLVCATLAAASSFGLTLRASSCALAGGR